MAYLRRLCNHQPESGKDQDARSGSVYAMLPTFLLGWFLEQYQCFYGVRATNYGGPNGEEWCLEGAMCFPYCYCIHGGDGIVYGFMTYDIAGEVFNTSVTYYFMLSYTSKIAISTSRLVG